MSNFNLHRFLAAQEQDYATALTEIENGRKRGHWMWYIFPQLKGLGSSSTSQFYGIHGLEEAKEYLKHPVLGNRLEEITTALLQLQTSNALEVMGNPDHLKLKSSMTLFSLVPGSDPVFEKILEKYYSGEKDLQTIKKIDGT